MSHFKTFIMNENLISTQFFLNPLPIQVKIIGCKNEESLSNYLINEGIELNDNSFPKNDTYVFLRGKTVYLIIYLSEFDNLGTICHESIHIVDKIFQAIEQPEHTITNDELIPYYTGYLVNQIIQFLEENEILTLTFNNQVNEK